MSIQNNSDRLNTDMSLFKVIKSDMRFSDIVVDGEKVNQLNQVIKEFYEWDVLVKHKISAIKRLLFYGQSGCGKKLMGEVLASEIGIPMLYVSFDKLIDMNCSDVFKNIKNIFDYVKNSLESNWLIFFDGFDKVYCNENNKLEYGILKRIVNYLFFEIDNYREQSLIVFSASNKMSFDYDICKYFDEVVKFDLPTTEDKLKLFDSKTKCLTNDGCDIKKYFNDVKQFTHSDIISVALTIRKMCILDNRKKYTEKDIKYAIFKQKNIVDLRVV